MYFIVSFGGLVVYIWLSVNKTVSRYKTVERNISMVLFTIREDTLSVSVLVGLKINYL